MRGAQYQYMRVKGSLPKLDAVGAAKARHAEDCELRLARITNGKEPSHKNGFTRTQQNITGLLKKAGRQVVLIDETS